MVTVYRPFFSVPNGGSTGTAVAFKHEPLKADDCVNCGFGPGPESHVDDDRCGRWPIGMCLNHENWITILEV